MKNKIFFSLFLFGFPLFLFGQPVPSYSLSSSEENIIEGNCQTLDIWVGENPKMFLNDKDQSLTFFFAEFPLAVDTHFFKDTVDRFYYETDTVKSENERYNLIDPKDEKFNLSEFELIKLKDFEESDSIEFVLYEKEIDFVGDAVIDKIKITSSTYVSKNGERPLVIEFYENRNYEDFKLENCSIFLWKRPRSIYVSKKRYLGMSIIFILKEGDLIYDNDNYFLIISRDIIRW